MLRPKKVGTLPVEGSDEQKRTNEIGMAIPLLETCDIAGKDITGDALLTQRAIATYVVQQQAHYHFTVKGNQRWKAISPCYLKSAAPSIMPSYRLPIMAASKRGAFGVARNSTTTSTFPTSGRSSSSNANPSTKNPANRALRSHWESRAAR